MFAAFHRSRTCLLLIIALLMPYSHAVADTNPASAIPSHLAAHSLLTDITTADNILVAVGERGHVIYSTDNGDSWKQSDVPSQSLLTAVFMLNSNNGWAVGHDTIILATTDGARTWQIQYHAPEKEQPLLDVWFKDEKHGIAIGAYGLYVTTEDGGNSWKETAISKDDFHLNALHVTDSGYLYIAGEAGTLYRSLDNGKKWKKIKTPYQGSFFNILSLKDGSLLVFGLRGNLYHSKNDGRKWEKINTKTDISLFDAIQLPNETILISTLGGQLLVGNGSGKNFLTHKVSGAKGILALIRAANGDIVLAGESGISRITSLQSLR